MRHIKLLLWMIMSLCAISCSAQRTFSEVSSIKGVISVYVGKTMLNIAGETLDAKSGQSAIDISKLVKQLTSIELIHCENPSVGKKVEKMCENILSKYPFEIITEVSSDNQNVTISGVFKKNNKYLDMILIAVKNNDTPMYVLLKGNISVDTLNKALISNNN